MGHAVPLALSCGNVYCEIRANADMKRNRICRCHWLTSVVDVHVIGMTKPSSNCSSMKEPRKWWLASASYRYLTSCGLYRRR